MHTVLFFLFTCSLYTLHPCWIHCSDARYSYPGFTSRIIRPSEGGATTPGTGSPTRAFERHAHYPVLDATSWRSGNWYRAIRHSLRSSAQPCMSSCFPRSLDEVASTRCARRPWTRGGPLCVTQSVPCNGLASHALGSPLAPCVDVVDAVEMSMKMRD